MIATKTERMANQENKVAKARQPGIAVYLRESSGNQFISPISQWRSCLRHIEILGMPMIPDMWNGPDNHKNPLKKYDEPIPGVFYDFGESAFRTQFSKRAAGMRLLAAIQPGDVVMVWRMDRLCRSVADFCEISSEFTRRQVRLVICSPCIDMGTANGRMLARHLANLAEWESDRKGERIRDALAAKRKIISQKPTQLITENLRKISLPSGYRPVLEPQTIIKNKPGRIMIYLRCSHRDSEASGLGMYAQLDIARSYAQMLIDANPLLTAMEPYCDSVVSSYMKDLRCRPAGRNLDRDLMPGDHVVFSTLDRGFRSVRDMVNTIPDWKERGVEIHFAADRMCMSDPGGVLLATAIAQFAELESQLTSERTKESKAIKRIAGEYAGGAVPSFWKLIKFGEYQKLVLDRSLLAEFRLIRLYLGQGMSLQNSLERIENLIALRERRPAIPQCGLYPRAAAIENLPQDYPRDKKGCVWPKWHRHRYRKSRPSYEAALKAWRNAAAMRREDRDETPQKPASSKEIA